MKKILFSLLILCTLFNNTYAGDDTPSLKDIFDNIVKDSVKVIGETSSKKSRGKNSRNETKGDYKALDIEGTFSNDCDDANETAVYFTQENRNKTQEFYWRLEVHGKKTEEGTSLVTKDKDTGIFSQKIGKDNINYLLVDDGYIRMVWFDNNFKIKSVLTKCSLSRIKDKGKTQVLKKPRLNDIDKENIELSKFDIKDLKIGAPIPGEKCPETKYERYGNNNKALIEREVFTYQNFEDRNPQRCTFDTTILDVPYRASVTLLDGKIYKVHFMGIPFELNKFQNVEPREYFKEMKFVGDDAKNHIDSFVAKVSDKLGQPSVQKTRGYGDKFVQNLESDETSVCKNTMNISGVAGYQVCNATFKENLKTLREAFNKACGKCEYTEYVFNWDGDYKAELKATVPDFKNSPGLLTSATFNYASKDSAEELDNYGKRKMEALMKGTNVSDLSETYIKAVQEAKDKFNARRNNDF